MLNALRVHTNFRAKLVISKGKYMAAIEDVEIPPVYKADGSTRRMGTKETEGLQLYADYDDRTITLHIFHGFSDFRGICAFLKILFPERPLRTGNITG